MTAGGILSAVLFWERALCGDQTYHTYNAMVQGGPFYVHGRVLTALYVTIPGLMSNWAFPADKILFAYSVSNWIVHFVLWGITALVLRRPDIALAIPIMFSLGVRHTFYYACSDTLLGLSFLVPLMVLISTRRRHGVLLVFIVLLYVAMLMRWIHYSLLFPVILLFLLDLCRGRRAFDLSRWLPLGLTVIVGAILLQNIPEDTYVGERTFGASIPTFDTLASLLPVLLELLWLPLLASVIVGTFMIIRTPAWRTMPGVILTVCAPAAYFAVLILKWSILGSLPYTEHLALPITAVVATSAVLWCLPRVQPRWRQIVVGLLLVWGLAGIWHARHPYCAYVSWLDSATQELAKLPESKFMWIGGHRPDEMRWYIPIQSLLLSNALGRKPVTILRLEEQQDQSQFSGDEGIVLRTWDNQRVQVSDLPAPLSIADTAYLVLSEEQKKSLLAIADSGLDATH